jgi:transcriptional regulator NrdR family protein
MEARYESKMQECKNQDEMAEYLLSCFSIIKEYTEEKETTETSHRALGVNVKVHKGTQRKAIYKKYMNEIEGHYETEDYNGVPRHTRPCEGCGRMFTKIVDDVEADEICTACGRTERFQEDELGFKEEQETEKHIIYSYKRENHFNEWISQFQAKESTSVPDELLNQLRAEFKKQKIKDLVEITHEKVRSLLKKLDKNKYYEHAPYIATMLSGIQPPTMPQELEDKLRIMFHKIQAPFDKHKPANRKNFLSYSYVLYKLCELLGEDRYLPCFPLLKSKEKLYIQDQIWKGICGELSWEYYKTQ